MTISVDQQRALQCWVSEQVGHADVVLSAITGDAGFRSYFRFNVNHQSFIAVDSPPLTEKNQAFVSVLNAFEKAGLHVPKLLHHDLTHGWFILSDLGQTLYLHVLQTMPQQAESLYRAALTNLLALQRCDNFPEWTLPPFDEHLYRQECELFLYWFLQEYCQLILTKQESLQLGELFEQLIESALTQPQVCVHRDYHSRNLLVNEQDPAYPGIIDFQDAVLGPITYDAVSLLKDCYIHWPQEQIQRWSQDFCDQLVAAKRLSIEQKMLWPQWFDWMGMQRHIKCVGIFARLALRDNKWGYLPEIPRVLKYLVQTARDYPTTTWFADAIEERYLPRFYSMRQPEAVL